MTIISQRSFSSGELSPEISARADLAKYQTGVGTLRNFLVMKQGGAQNRPGTEFCCEVSDSTRRVRMIEFEFSLDQTYMLEFGHLYMRALKNGALVSTVHANLVTGISVANQAVVSHTAHGYTTGDEVQFFGLLNDMARFNGRVFKVETINTNSYYIKLDGAYLSTTGLTAFAGIVTAYKIFKLTTPYVEADLQTLNYIESADVITLTHPNYPTADLSRLGDANWTLVTSVYKAAVEAPTTASVTAGAAGAIVYSYYVTSVKRDTYEESLPAVGTGTPKNITNAVFSSQFSVGSPYYFGITFTIAAHGYSVGDQVIILGIGTDSMYEVNNRVFKITTVTANTFEIQLDTAGYHAYNAASPTGTATKVTLSVSSAAPTPSAPNVVTWSTVSTAVEYNIYRSINGVFGYLGTAEGTTFNDVGTTVDVTQGPPTEKAYFLGTGNYPSTATYYQQRKLFANSTLDPETVWGSRSGQYNNFTFSHPLQDDDSITFTLAGRKVNRIKHMLDLGKLVLLTEQGEFGAGGDDGSPITATNPQVKQYSYNGCGDLKPLLIDDTALYAQATGTTVRDLGFNFESNGFKGIDLTAYSTHLFEKFQIKDWAYQKTPNSIAWTIRSDGKFLGLTYIKDQQMLAWHRHDFNTDIAENIASCHEGQNDRVYFVVKRVINGVTRRYIERFSIRAFSDVKVDCKILDAALTYDGRNLDATKTMTLSGGTTWANTERFILTSNVSYFNVTTDIGNEIHLTTPDGVKLRCKILSDLGNSPTQVKVSCVRNIPVNSRNVALSTWSKAVSRLTGYWHLEGRNVSIFADGFVEANPNNETYVVHTVTNGVVTMDRCYSVIHVGTPITSDLETLDIESTNAESMVGKKINIGKVSFKMFESRSLFAGPEKPSDADELTSAGFLNGLVEEKLRDSENYDDPVALTTGQFSIVISPDWNSSGRVFVRNTDPIPCTILSIHPEGYIPTRGGQ